MKSIRNWLFSTPVIWFLVIFGFSLAVGVLAGKSVSAAYRGAQPEVIVEPAAAQPAAQTAIEQDESALKQVEAPAPKAPQPTTESATIEAETDRVIKFNQHNLLILQVDNLRSTQPRLQALWLAIHLPEMGQVMLLPLYPEIKDLNGSGMAAALHTITEMPSPVDAGGNPHPALLEALGSTGLWWHHSLVLDQIALIELLDQFHRAAAQGSSQPGFNSIQEVAALAGQEENAEAYIRASARLYGQICALWASGSGTQANSSDVGAFSPEHLKTDLPAGQAAQNEAESPEAAAAARSDVHCQFPSLETGQ